MRWVFKNSPVNSGSPNSEVVKKYGAGKTKSTQIIKGNGNRFSVMKNQMCPVCF